MPASITDYGSLPWPTALISLHTEPSSIHSIQVLRCDQLAHTVGTDNLSYGWKLTMGDNLNGHAVREHCLSTDLGTLTTLMNWRVSRYHRQHPRQVLGSY